MNLSLNTILITGGASGIGLALAERFLEADNEVIICGRRKEKLREAQEKYPALKIYAVDVAVESERVNLFNWATSEFPNLNVLINNAGIQRRIDLNENESWDARRQEIAINFDAPVHLASLFIAHLKKQKNPAIANVTSGLSFAPLANVPVYSATKAALHSFTLSLRNQLAPAGIEVIEIVPPAVDTDLGGAGLHTFGVNVNDFADAVFDGLKNGETEIAYGSALGASRASREQLNEIFDRMNQNS